MTIVALGQAGQHGVITDVAPEELPPNAWSSGNNVRFKNGAAEKLPGHQSLWGGAQVAPYFVMPVRAISGDIYWIYAGQTAVWAYEVTGPDAETHVDITRLASPYTTQEGGWQGGVLNGVPMLNNGVDAPQMWLPVEEATPLADLTAWPAATTAKVIRAFRNFFIALDVTKAGVRDARLVKWSHPASAGAVPTSWDETDPTLDAGEYSIADTEGILLDGLPLRDTFILYKDDSVWGMQFIGGNDIFKFFPIFRNVGAAGKHCALEYMSGRHIVLARDVLYTHDGQTITQIASGLIHDWLFTSIDPSNIHRSFLVLDSANDEVWVCYPTAGNTWPSKALIWNFVTGKFGFRDLPTTAHIAWGVLNVGSTVDKWNSDASTWAAPGYWSDTGVSVASAKLVIASHTDSKLLGVLDSSPDFDGATETAELERTGIGIPFTRDTPPDISTVKFCTRIWPKITGTAGMTVQIRLGSQMEITDTPTWGAWQDFVIGTTLKLDVTMSGRMFAIGVRSTEVGMWKLQGLSFDVQRLGNF